ncbi:AcrR family transcriptional regulator [Janthinobacterium sp. CG_23.3]|uniref:TetR/AcrR family transcriptional regulator n=1 Tax=Janthinobacterium sp. CG_23.3 TaxID=3349634 RepID=UPI0038D3F2E9
MLASPPTSINGTARQPRHAWLDAGLALLTGGGADALTIDQLCVAVGRSKGSFYHHFADVDAYAEALLDHWQELHTENVERAVDQLSSVWERRMRLANLALTLDGAIERAMRQWGARSPLVLDRLRDIDQRRIAYLAGLIAELRDDGDRADALDLARIEYATFVGMLYVFPDGRHEDMLRMLRRFIGLMTPEAPTRTID